MSELRDLLSQALGTTPSVPADPKLSAGVEATAYWTFAPHLEVVLAEAERLPPEGQAVAAWTKRLSKRATPLVLIIEAGEEQLLVGPSGKPPPALGSTRVSSWTISPRRASSTRSTCASDCRSSGSERAAPAG